jgi:diaminohydroxyphosphoribosylaminopyrimidine deaminase/5-amino-6-(5-phosphoribosylamino)uracil reductase
MQEGNDRRLETDVAFMNAALRQARRGVGRTSPNPAVGAVVVKNGKTLATGYHRKAGAPHAEVEALGGLGGQAKGATLYVTLEPCHHHGRTPPCTEAILKSGVKRVVVGMPDPNPEVRGGGCAFLRAKGLQVDMGILEDKCRRLNEAYVKFVTRKRPFVIAKSAMTLDGWTATGTGHARWITGERSRRFVHGLRDRADAVMVGVGTVLADDPMLTARLGARRGRDPLRVIVDTHLRTPPNAKVLHLESSADTVLAVGRGLRKSELKRFERPGVATLPCPKKARRIDLNALMDILGGMGVMSLLVEGGASLMGSLLRGRLVDKVYIFKAPRLLCGSDGIPFARGQGPKRMDRSLRLREISVRRFEEDVLLVGYPEYI